MSISLFLEVEAGADLSAVLHALDSIQAEYVDGTDGLHGYLPASNASFGFGIVDPREALAAEGIEAEWQVGLLGSFHFRASGFESAWEEICRFINRYAAACEFRFVLSFQFESIYAARLGKDLVFPGPAAP
ncbi:hypothetical protein V3O09_19255 [Stenotrophomonas maltophilia]|uniref:Uncharacterized protein n=1 Tax=Stenotrophomonas maltophilia (strain K279a) TaxID=522373 RepID=B2FUD4_STRMK|nr:hypothetical protein [Stenotrophomonas maltophilia]EKU9964429.1 hypothetical protein [Stenotrophomonas maltophilia]MBA0335246.1 hypothetical protein [Stenotrophomonas maltophilia]MBA0539383.1 hypothetical protein [Stenotrophomonas maltophilia]MBH1741789.1 hypothetical protein [Stenotrophomonas maltophilia]PJL22684.1 hypothetical protein B9Y71_06770 [Stenotrophomonas maltophilia]